MKEEFLDYVEHIIEAMDDAQSFVKDMDLDAFVKDVIQMLSCLGGYSFLFRP